MRTFFTLVTAAVLCLMLAGCNGGAGSGSSVPASSSSVPTSSSEIVEPSATPGATALPSANPSASEMPGATLSSALVEALNASVAYGSDTAGGSLKTAQVSAALVQVLVENGVPDRLQEGAAAWKATLTEEQRTLLSLNWASVSRVSRDIAADPASQKDLLASAGIGTDFTTMDLSGIPAAMDSLDAALL